MRAWPLAVALVACGGGLVGCGAGNHIGPQQDGSGDDGSADGGTDATLPPGWTELVARSWSLDYGGDEGYR